MPTSFTQQQYIIQWMDAHMEDIVDYLITNLQDASTIEQVEYDPEVHRGLLVNYVHEGVQNIVQVSPESLLSVITMSEQEVIARVNAACQSAEDLNDSISAAETLRQSAESGRVDAEAARVLAETARENAESARDSAEDDRETAEAARELAETARENAETSRSSWFTTFRATVESWYSNPDDGTGIVQIWNAFIAAATSWKDDAVAAWNSFFGATAESEGGVRKIWDTWFGSTQSNYAAFNDTMTNNEQTRQNQEAARVTAENARVTSENNRGLAEDQRASAEQGRVTAEQGRVTAEQQRVSNEGARENEEAARDSAEDQRASAESQRASAETSRQTDYTALMANIQQLYQDLLTRANHPAQFGEDGYIYEYDLTTGQYVKTEHFWAQFTPFEIAKEFSSYAAMEAYDPDNLPEGETPLATLAFVIISSDTEDPDNSKLYVYRGENVDEEEDFERWHFVGDFSGAQGFTGKTPQLSIGTVTAGDPGTSPVVSITANGQDASGNPCYLINFTIPRGADGRGIASMEQVTRSSDSEGENIWRATFTDGDTADFIVLNGAQGANAGIGEATATVDSGVGTPSVTINTGGTNANRIFSFAFHNVKGATFTPSVDENGNLSWSNDGGLTNPTTFNILSAIPLCTQLQQGLMSAADKEKLDLLPSLSTSTISELTADNVSGQTAFWGTLDEDTGKWALQKMSAEELQKLAYNYIKQSGQLTELASLLGVNKGVLYANDTYTMRRGLVILTNESYGTMSFALYYSRGNSQYYEISSSRSDLIRVSISDGIVTATDKTYYLNITF